MLYNSATGFSTKWSKLFKMSDAAGVQGTCPKEKVQHLAVVEETRFSTFWVGLVP